MIETFGPRSRGTGDLVNEEFLERILKAIVLVVTDEINILRSEVSDLKARVALLDSGEATVLPERTHNQIKPAIRGKIDAM